MKKEFWKKHLKKKKREEKVKIKKNKDRYRESRMEKQSSYIFGRWAMALIAGVVVSVVLILNIF